MTQVSVEHIAIDDKGVARLVGRRIKVHQIVLDKQSGMSPDEIQAAYPHLSLAEIYAALAYYYDHREVIDEQIREEDRLADEGLERQRNDPHFQAFMADLKQRSRNR